MKKIFTTLAMTAFVMTGFAQQYQQYWRVEFTVPITGNAYGTNNAVAATMKDNYTYCNAENEYLDFQANGNLTARGEANAMGFRTTSTASANSSFYLENGRLVQGGVVQTYPYLVDKIKKITAYSIPVEKVSLIDSIPTRDVVFIGNNKTYRASDFTFNRLPRNVAELKTLMENADGSRVEATNNPMFLAAVTYLVVPRLRDCSQDCWDMLNYLWGVQYSQLNTIGVSNGSFQDQCISKFSGNGCKDGNGFWLTNKLYQHFAGASPLNEYCPDGKNHGYDNGPYKVRVAWDTASPIMHSGQLNTDIARLLLWPNPDATDTADISFEELAAHIVQVRATKKNGWFMHDGEKIYFQQGKDQVADF